VVSTSSTSAAAIDRTVSVWRPRYRRELSQEEGRQIRENVTGFFAVLAEWSRLERLETNAEALSQTNEAEVRHEG